MSLPGLGSQLVERADPASSPPLCCPMQSFAQNMKLIKVRDAEVNLWSREGALL